MPEEEKMFIPIKELTRKRTDDFRFVHANSANVSETFWDTSLIFGAVVPDSELGAYVEERVAVSMSWEHLKALSRVLLSRVESYEQENGVIREPKPLAEQAEDVSETLKPDSEQPSS